MRLRLRLSLFARMAVSLAILLSITLVIAALLSVVGAFLGLAILGWLYRGAEAIAGLPRVSAVASVHPLLVAGLATLGIVAAVGGWPHVRARTDEEYLLPPTTPISAAITAVVLACLYLAFVEGGAALLAGLSTLAGVVGVVALGVLLAIGVTVGEVRRRVEAIREEVLAASIPVDDATLGPDAAPGLDAAPDLHAAPGLGATTRRLAQLADVPVPELRVTETDRPESFTVDSGDEAVAVVSTGLVDRLSADELEAVLAHEVSHLANGDSRVLGAALAPVLAADEWIEADPDRLGDYVWNWLFGALKTYAQFGVAVLARGREWGADAGAAELTGSPGALASALRELSADRCRPETDLREWEQAVAVADLLPPAGPVVSTGPFRTHPPTEDRIEHLARLFRAAESED